LSRTNGTSLRALGATSFERKRNIISPAGDTSFYLPSPTGWFKGRKISNKGGARIAYFPIKKDRHSIRSADLFYAFFNY